MATIKIYSSYGVEYDDINLVINIKGHFSAYLCSCLTTIGAMANRKINKDYVYYQYNNGDYLQSFLLFKNKKSYNLIKILIKDWIKKDNQNFITIEEFLNNENNK